MAMLISLVSFAQDAPIYELVPATGSNNSYAGNCDITIDGIKWNLTGNSTMQPWRIGGKSITNQDRALYSKTPLAYNIDKIEVTHGTATDITVNSFKLIISDEANGAGETIDVAFKASATTTIDLPEGDYTNKYFKFLYNVTVSATSNKFVQFTGAKFYAALAADDVKAPVITGAEDFISETEVTIEAEEDVTVYYTLDGTEPTTASTVYAAPFTVEETTTVKAVAYRGEKASFVTSATFTKATQVTCAEAAELAMKVASNNALTPITYVVYGYVTAVDGAVSNGQQKFWVSDTKDGENTLYSYYCNVPQALEVGNYVQMFGKLTKYNSTPQMKNGDVTILPEPAEEEINYETFTMSNLAVTPMGDFDLLEASDDMMGISVTLGVYADGSLHAASAVLFNGETLKIVEGNVTKAYNEEVATDVYTARLVVEFMGGKLGLEIMMYASAAAEPVEVAIEGAEVEVVEATGTLQFTATWTDSTTMVTYPVLVTVAAYEEAEFKEYEGAQISELTIGDDDNWFDFAVANAVAVFKDGNVFSLEGEYTSWNTGTTYNVMIEGTLPKAEEPLPAASVRAWAYDLALAVEGEQYTFSYKATTAAKATLIFTDAEGAELSTVDLGVVEAGANSKVLAATELPEAAEINWAIKLEAGAIADFVEVTDATKGIYNFYLPQGVAVDNNPESATFGTIYVAESTDGASDGGSDRADTQKRGIFVYNQNLEELNPTNVGIIPSNVTLGDASRQALRRVVLNPVTNEVVFAHNVVPMAVWAVPAENVGGEAKNLIEGLGFTNVNAICFGETGALYVLVSPGYPAPGSLYKVENGVVDTLFADNARFGNADVALASDGRGGVWIAQNRGQLDGFNQLTHVNAAGAIDYEVNSTTPNGFESQNTARGTMAYNYNEDVLALGIGASGAIGASLYKVTYDEAGVPTLEFLTKTPSMGKNVDGLAFDYAGDLYGLSANKERFYKFAVPTADNVCTTPAASKYAIKLVEEYTVTATVNPAEAGVIAGLAEGGIYVKGAEATLTATAAEGYEFVNWTVADSVVSTEATYTFTVVENVEVVANFKEVVKAVEVNVTDATATSGEWSIDLVGSWNDQALTIKLRQDNTQGFGSYAPNTETGYYILLGAKELTPTTEGVYADNGDGTFTFTCSATEGTTQYNITVTGTSGAQEVYYETFELTNLKVTDNETFLVLEASDMNMGLAVMLGVNIDGTLMDASEILFGEEVLPILSSEPVKVTFNEDLQTDVYTARVVVEHMGGPLGLELIMYAGGATSEPIAVNVIGATAAVDEATDVLKITGDWDGIAFELRINAYDPAKTNYDAPQIAEFETEEVYATSSLVTVIKTGENIDVIGDFMSPMGDIYKVYVNAKFAAGPETGVDNIQVENTTVKVVEDGQVFIIRNGVKFNANGAVVK